MKNSTKKIIVIFSMITIFMTTLVYAAGAMKTIKALLNGFSVTVNGNKVVSDSIYYNGKVYIPATTLGKALGVKTVIDSKNKLLSFGIVDTPKVITKPGKITKAAFDKLKNGMSYEEATSIIGYNGELISESGEKGDSTYTVMYMYYGSGILGSNANLMFQGDKLMNKAQMGLK